MNTTTCSRLNAVAIVCFVIACARVPAAAQTTATLTGRILDQQGAALAGAEIRLTNAVTGFEVVSTSSADATFRVTNIPLQTYRLMAEFPGFKPATRNVDLRTSVPVAVELTLDLAAQTDTVTVSAADPGALVDPTLTGTRTAVSLAIIQHMPAATGSRGLQLVLGSVPGLPQTS